MVTPRIAHFGRTEGGEIGAVAISLAKIEDGEAPCPPPGVLSCASMRAHPFLAVALLLAASSEIEVLNRPVRAVDLDSLVVAPGVALMAEL
ncbi:MAG TPA: hypothetical protein VLS89_19010 [Candidatus Nanopelagicales bacterium]|nr:hypothetical protein [Candidatus Nanopelagicales bacterium]